jgi:hypothetical protein
MVETIPETPPDYDKRRILERPDGFYWQSRLDDSVYGPFPSLLEAVQDMQVNDDPDAELEEVPLDEAEQELGITDWIDEDTGEPAEEGTPRLKQH